MYSQLRKPCFLQIKTESPVKPGSPRQGSRRKLMSGHFVGQLAGRCCLSDVRFADSFLTIDNSIIIIAATDVIIGFWMLSGQVFPQGGLSGEFSLASGARDLCAGPRRRR